MRPSLRKCVPRLLVTVLLLTACTAEVATRGGAVLAAGTSSRAQPATACGLPLLAYAAADFGDRAGALALGQGAFGRVVAVARLGEPSSALETRVLADGGGRLAVKTASVSVANMDAATLRDSNADLLKEAAVALLICSGKRAPPARPSQHFLASSTRPPPVRCRPSSRSASSAASSRAFLRSRGRRRT